MLGLHPLASKLMRGVPPRLARGLLPSVAIGAIPTHQEPPPEGAIHTGKFQTSALGKFASEVEYLVITPPEYDRSEKLPVVFHLHDLLSSTEEVVQVTKPLFEHAWNWNPSHMDGRYRALDRCVVASFNAFRGVGNYMDFHDGSMMYEKMFLNDWMPFIRSSFAVSHTREQSWLFGLGMGGFGALNLGFRRPELFAGVCAVYPFLDPVIQPSDLITKFMGFRGDIQLPEWAPQPPHGSMGAMTKAMYGGVHPKDWDKDTYQRFNPMWLAKANAANIRDSGIQIQVNASMIDSFNSNVGAERLHKVLWGQRIEHGYHTFDTDRFGAKSLAQAYHDGILFMEKAQHCFDPEDTVFMYRASAHDSYAFSFDVYDGISRQPQSEIMGRLQ